MTIVYFMPGLVVNGRAWTFSGSTVLFEDASYTQVFGVNAQGVGPVTVRPPHPLNDNKEAHDGR
jgi:hypothetical protein